MPLFMKPILWVLESLVGKLGKTLVTMIMSMASEKFMQWMLLDLATRITKYTTNTADDVWLAKFIENLKEVEAKEE